MLKQIIVAGAAAAALGSGLAQAQTPPASPHTITANIGLYSQYIFRGLNQTNEKPALQGGADYSHSSGFYVGTWASNIKWLRQNFSTPAGEAGQYNDGGELEWDFYGGYKWGFAPDWTLDLGGLYYWYPGDITPGCTYGLQGCPKADTFELYAGLTWKWFTAKYSHSVLKHTFGVPESRNTYYIDLSLNLPLGDVWKNLTGWTFMAHWGRQKYDGEILGVPFNNDTLFSYEDWKVGISYTLPHDFTIGAFYTDTSKANPLAYGSVGEGGPFPKNIAKSTGTVYIMKTF